MSSRLVAELHVARLLRMLAGVEEAIIHLENHADSDRDRVAQRLRVVQDEIASVLRRLDADAFARRPERGLGA